MKVRTATFVLAALMTPSMTTGAELIAKNTQSALRLIEDVQKLIPLRREPVEKFFEITFVTVRKNESMTFFRAYDVSHGGLDLNELDLRLASTRALDDIFVVSMTNPCITRKEIQPHVPAQPIPDTNDLPTPGPVAYDRYASSWGELRLGYHVESRCLVHLVFAPGKG